MWLRNCACSFNRARKLANALIHTFIILFCPVLSWTVLDGGKFKQIHKQTRIKKNYLWFYQFCNWISVIGQICRLHPVVGKKTMDWLFIPEDVTLTIRPSLSQSGALLLHIWYSIFPFRKASTQHMDFYFT